ncbi:type VII secretion-associated serine protease mycosin [Actinomadura napierensis]|uniref:Type VII secretion-associated serine protease mycosin n=1 Tax=Actinomadura napierensis TaxID=267854 RepID=A0ABN2ZXN8_9ACTN
MEAKLPDLAGVVLSGEGDAGSASRDGRADSDTKLGGHGTGMAALIASQGSGTGMVGIAPRSHILPIVEPPTDFNKSIYYAVNHGAKVINISQGVPATTCPGDLRAAVLYAVHHDVIIVAAAGNKPFYESSYAPANCPGVLAVGALDAHLAPWQKSTPGANVMLAAPGVSVGSIGKEGIFTPGVNGTSSAAALTSGVVALMRSRFPNMSGREVVQRMLATARDLGPKGWDKKTGYGALVPYKALTARVASDFPNPVYDKVGIATSSNGDIRERKSSANNTPPVNRPRVTAHGNSGSTVWKATGAATAFFALIFVTAVGILAKKRKST